MPMRAPSNSVALGACDAAAVDEQPTSPADKTATNAADQGGEGGGQRMRAPE